MTISIIEVIVKSNNIVHHIVENDTVISYSNLRVGGDKIPENYLSRLSEPLTDGYISLQSEGHPVEFRNIKIKILDWYYILLWMFNYIWIN